jgi:uncharacterized protein YbjT (DUF2867 family)
MDQPKETAQKPQVVVAGASGFIGQALGRALSHRFNPVALSRSRREPGAGYLECRQADLFSLSGATKALHGADYAVYLVHSMMPAARLVQGTFSDLDILCADNFGRAAAANGVRRILYVGGLVPDGAELSEHLKSRLEVESALGSGGVPVTTLRAGMVVGARGSSYQLLARLVRRLPIMACPRWTQTRMQPVSLHEVVASIEEMLDEDGGETRCFDLGTDESLSYLELMQTVAVTLGLRRRFIAVPFLSPRLSRLWVCLTTGAPAALVSPLVESLEHEMVVRPQCHFRPREAHRRTVEQMLQEALLEERDLSDAPRAFRKSLMSPAEDSKVSSVQRLHPPRGCDARWLASTYTAWLATIMGGLIQIESVESTGEVRFMLGSTNHKLLGLQPLAERSQHDRQVFRVTAGLLARKTERGRLEFRQVLGGTAAIAALQDFVPRLPWWLYRLTQGTFHGWVMNQFRSHVAMGPPCD